MSDLTIFSDTFLAMGSHCDVVLPGVDAEFARTTFSKIKEEVEQLEAVISRFSLVSSIWEINNSPKNKWLEVPDDIWELLVICNDFHQISNGAFDVTMFPLQHIWSENKTPNDDELQTEKNKCGFDKIEFDFEKRKIQFLADDVELDFSAIEKAYALDIVKSLLEEVEVKNAIVNFEENAVLAFGKHPEGEYWPLGIRNQQKPNEFLHVFQTKNQFVNTAGTVVIHDDGAGMKPHTVISPAYGAPVKGRKTVSVKSNSALMGAFIANIWLILPENDKTILADQFKNVEILETEYLDDDIKTKVSVIEGEN